MSATLAPQGLIPSRHLSGIIRVENQVDGILSTYATSLYTGTPVKRGTDGTIQATTTTVADACIGVFQGCEFSATSKRFVLPYWPAGQTYDAGTMIAKYTYGKGIVYEAQSSGSLAATSVGEGINLANNSQGSTYTGFSTQAVGAATGATVGTFLIHGLAPYDDNAWGDAFTRILVTIYADQIAVA